MRKNQRAIIKIMLIISCVWLSLNSGCATTQKVETETLDTPVSPSDISPSISPAPLMPQSPLVFSSSVFLAEDYLIGPGDILDIAIFDMEDLSRKVRVGGDGHISMPLIGRVFVSGLSSSELETVLAEKYAEKYLQKPHVSVFIEEFHSKRVAVLGQVKQPQVLELPRNTSNLLEVISLCGGLEDQVGDTIYIIRPATREEEEKVITVNVSELIEYHNPLANKEILPGDTVSIPPASFYFIVGEVDKPGAYMITPGMTVLQAISQGGKFSKIATNKVKVIREDPVQGRQIISTINLKRIAKSKDDRVLVKSGDILLVGESTAKHTFHDFIDFTKVVVNAFAYGFAIEAARGN